MFFNCEFNSTFGFGQNFSFFKKMQLILVKTKKVKKKNKSKEESTNQLELIKKIEYH